ncbi:MAG: efflux RND transporter periplasmic adaptor subunit [Gemmatimonadota bacterium]
MPRPNDLATYAVLLVVGTAACTKKSPAPSAPPPVSVASATRQDVPLLVEATGTAEPTRSVAIEAQVGGVLTRVAFSEGQPVTAGQLLFEIDPRQYRAALSQAEAALARDAAQAAAVLLDLKRVETLSAQQYLTQQQLDQARANAATQTATLRLDSAQVTQAQINLQRASITAPISGRAGTFLLREGNLVRANSGEPMVVINQISPIRVRFPVAADQFDAVRRRASGSLVVTATAISDSAASAPQTGRLVFLDNAVDPTTGTVALKAEFPNPGGVLWPGALVRVTLRLELERGVVVVPRAAVQNGQSGTVVWVIDSSSTARLRPVQVRRTTDSLAVLNSGIHEGDRVVIDGQLKLVDGSKVSVRGAEKSK